MGSPRPGRADAVGGVGGDEPYGEWARRCVDRQVGGRLIGTRQPDLSGAPPLLPARATRSALGILVLCEADLSLAGRRGLCRRRHPCLDPPGVDRNGGGGEQRAWQPGGCALWRLYVLPRWSRRRLPTCS